jgi:hypothetical protein
MKGAIAPVCFFYIYRCHNSKFFMFTVFMFEKIDTFALLNLR